MKNGFNLNWWVSDEGESKSTPAALDFDVDKFEALKLTLLLFKIISKKNQARAILVLIKIYIFLAPNEW